MKGLCDEIHAMGLKAGIYSTPWITSYAKFPGGSSDDPAGRLGPRRWRTRSTGGIGKYLVCRQRRQPVGGLGIRLSEVRLESQRPRARDEMSKALRACGRDIVFSLSNSAPFEHAADWAGWPTAGAPPATSGTTGTWRRWRTASRNRLHPGPLGAVRRPGPLERSGHAGGRLRGLGPAAARDAA